MLQETILLRGISHFPHFRSLQSDTFVPKMISVHEISLAFLICLQPETLDGLSWLADFLHMIVSLLVLYT